MGTQGVRRLLPLLPSCRISYPRRCRDSLLVCHIRRIHVVEEVLSQQRLGRLLERPWSLPLLPPVVKGLHPERSAPPRALRQAPALGEEHLVGGRGRLAVVRFYLLSPLAMLMCSELFPCSARSLSSSTNKSATKGMLRGQVLDHLIREQARPESGDSGDARTSPGRPLCGDSAGTALETGRSPSSSAPVGVGHVAGPFCPCRVFVVRSSWVPGTSTNQGVCRRTDVSHQRFNWNVGYTASCNSNLCLRLSMRPRDSVAEGDDGLREQRAEASPNASKNLGVGRQGACWRDADRLRGLTPKVFRAQMRQQKL